jgi:hypothetical protein
MKKTVFIVLIAFFLITIGSVKGEYRPPNPAMDYVPQNIGIYDTYYGNFKETDCMDCHGDGNTIEIRHQYSAGAFASCPDGCPLSPQDCPICNITGSCSQCHIDAGPVGNLGYPHHRSDFAKSGQCTACHQPNLLVQTRSVRPPSYYPTAFTYAPTPFNCENCHWPSGSAAHQPPAFIDWNLWTGIPKPTTWPDDLPHPMPVEAIGPVSTGSLYPTKSYRPQDGLHHTVGGTVSPACFLCHANEPGHHSFNPVNPLLIRYCENCHSRDSLHGIEEHIIAGHGLTANQKCIACHGGLPKTSPVLGAVKPVLTSMSPRFGPEGTECNLYGKNFGSSGNILLTPRMGETDQTFIISSGECTWTNEVIVFTLPSALSHRNYNVRVETPNGMSNIWVFTLTGTQLCIPCPTLAPNIDSMEPLMGAENSLVTINGQNFGDRHTGDRDVLLVQGAGTIPAPIISWTDNKIQFRLPPETFASGTTHVKVQTENGESNQKDIELRTYPHIETMEHEPGTTNLRLNGANFGVSQQYVRPDRYGWVSTVILSHPNQTISISPDSITSWNDTEIQLTLPGNLNDVYGVTVETKYFYDSDGNSTFTSGIDTVYHTVASDPQELNLQKVMCILVPTLSSIARGGTLNFQATLTNNTGQSGTVFFATKVTLPNGNKYPASGYLIQPLEVYLNAHQSKSGQKSHTIPSGAQVGTYTYHGYVGRYGMGVLCECQFKFTITP